VSVEEKVVCILSNCCVVDDPGWP